MESIELRNGGNPVLDQTRDGISFLFRLCFYLHFLLWKRWFVECMAFLASFRGIRCQFRRGFQGNIDCLKAKEEEQQQILTNTWLVQFSNCIKILDDFV